MKLRRLLIATGTSCLVALLAWTQTKEAEHLPYTRYGWRSYMHGRSLSSDLVRSDILATPGWSPGEPLPLSPGKAVEIARVQFRTLVRDEEAWFVKEIILQCVGYTPAQDADHAWYYGIRFEPKVQPLPTNGPVRLESVVIAVDFSGRPGTMKEVGR